MSVSMLLAAAASAVTPSPVGNPDRWLTAYDIPEDAFRAGEDGFFFYKIVVGPSGEVEHCQIQQSRASKADQAAFCERVKRRFKFSPGRDPAGAASYAVVEENIAFILPEQWVRNGLERRADMIVEVRNLPGTKEGKRAVNVNVAVDAAGALRQCDPAEGAPANLGSIACKQLSSEWIPLPERNAAGEVVSYVRRMTVEFREGQRDD